MKLKKANMIIDLSWGSCGKGLIAGYLAERDEPDTLVTSWAANAGHVFVDANGRKYLHTMIPNGVVSPRLKTILIGPGSLIDPINFIAELESVKDHVSGVAILIHPHAAVILERHREEEAGPMTKIGSTKKGVGAAMIERIRRDPDNNNVAINALKGTPLEQFVCSVKQYNQALDNASMLQIEGAQGYGLSLYHGFYPYCTSRDITPMQVMADCGIPHGTKINVVGTMRTYPIRVANRYNEEGEMIGWSGPHYPDQEELDWKAIKHAPSPEVTTVTKLQRRIFTFSWMQAREAIRMCRPDEIFLNFQNYHECFEEAMDMNDGIDKIAASYGLPGVRYNGVGATVNDVIEIKNMHRMPDIWGVQRLREFYLDRDGD